MFLETHTEVGGQVDGKELHGGERDGLLGVVEVEEEHLPEAGALAQPAALADGQGQVLVVQHQGGGLVAARSCLEGDGHQIYDRWDFGVGVGENEDVDHGGAHDGGGDQELDEDGPRDDRGDAAE